MIRRSLLRRRRLGVVLLFLLWLALPGWAQAPRPAPAAAPTALALQPVPQAIRPTQFYVAAVRDERPGRPALATLLAPPLPRSLTSPGPVLVDLAGGVARALTEFVAQSVPRNAALRPLTIRVRACSVQETAGAPGWADGRLQLELAFDWQRGGQTIGLTTYRGAARYQRPLASPYRTVEPIVRQALVDALRYLDQWMGREATANLRLARRLQVVHTDFPFVPDADTLYYSPAHPLALTDFRAAPRPAGGFAGAVFPSFAYTAHTRLQPDGTLQLHVQTKVFVVRSSSWVLPSARDATTLNHEQRHFDLVQLVAERFQRKAVADSLTLDNFDARMQYQYLDSWREMNHLQDQYDAETRHGQDAAAQQRWDQRIEAELRQYGVKR